MDTKIEKNERWSAWLRNERHISDEVAEAAGLKKLTTSYDGLWLVIPIRDFDKTTLFKKYRRDPDKTDGPKYKYDKGATAALFGVDTLTVTGEKGVLIITEGELDALAMRTLGYQAVSSTGGSGTWKEEWNAYLDGYDVVLLYDADRAGIHGALRVLSTGLKARIAWLPVQYGKDPTEVIHAGEADSLREYIGDAAYYHVPNKETEVVARLADYMVLLKRLEGERLAVNASRTDTPFHRDIAIEWVKEQIEDTKEEIYRSHRSPSVKKYENDSGLARAKEYPIEKLVKTDRAGFAKCVWHEEETASMKVYTDHVYCFGCGKRGDPIDVYMAIKGCDFKTALNALQV